MTAAKSYQLFELVSTILQNCAQYSLGGNPFDAVRELDLQRRGDVIKAEWFMTATRRHVGVDDLLVVVLDIEMQVRPQQNFVAVWQEACLLQMTDEASNGNVVCKPM